LPLTETLKVVLGIPLVIVMGLSLLARKHPHVRWLQAFKLPGQLSPKQRTRLRTSQNRAAGAQLILLGLILPLAYAGLKAAFFSGVQPTEIVLVGVASAACIFLGIVALMRN
jgi:hypothetical protein